MIWLTDVCVCVQPDWSVNLGEGVVQIQVVTPAAGHSRLLVLGMWVSLQASCSTFPL